VVAGNDVNGDPAVHVLVGGETVFVVTDRDRLLAAARLSMDSGGYDGTASGRDEQGGVRGLAGGDVVGALVVVADPSAMVAAGCGGR
jgi:hypothetical protein